MMVLEGAGFRTVSDESGHQPKTVWLVPPPGIELGSTV